MPWEYVGEIDPRREREKGEKEGRERERERGIEK